MVKSVILVFLIVNVSFSQGMRRPSVEEQLKSLTEELNLNETQQDTIKVLLQETRDKMSKMRDEMMSGGGDRMSMMASFMEVFEEQNKKIKAVLNDDQKKKYDKIVEERMNQRRDRMRN